MLGLGGPEPLVGTLFSRHPDGARREEPGGRFSVRFAEAWTPDLGRTSGAKAQDLLRLEDHGRVQEREAAAGVLWEQPDYGLRVVALYPDFAVGGGADGEPRPYSRSDRPLEPWLEVTFLPKAGPPRRLLFSSRQPELTDRLNAPNLPEGVKLRYLHSGGTPPERVVVFTRGDQRVRLVEEGAVRRAEPLVLQRPFVVAPGLSVTPLAQFLHAEYRSDFAPAPEGGPGRPALLVRVTEPSTGRSERGWLGMSGPEGEPELHAFFGGRLGLAYAARPFGTSRPPAEWALVGAGLALGLLGALLAWKGGGADGPEEAA